MKRHILTVAISGILMTCSAQAETLLEKLQKKAAAASADLKTSNNQPAQQATSAETKLNIDNKPAASKNENTGISNLDEILVESKSAKEKLPAKKTPEEQTSVSYWVKEASDIIIKRIGDGVVQKTPYMKLSSFDIYEDAWRGKLSTGSNFMDLCKIPQSNPMSKPVGVGTLHGAKLVIQSFIAPSVVEYIGKPNQWNSMEDEYISALRSEKGETAKTELAKYIESVKKCNNEQALNDLSEAVKIAKEASSRIPEAAKLAEVRRQEMADAKVKEEASKKKADELRYKQLASGAAKVENIKDAFLLYKAEESILGAATIIGAPPVNGDGKSYVMMELPLTQAIGTNEFIGTAKNGKLFKMIKTNNSSIVSEIRLNIAGLMIGKFTKTENVKLTSGAIATIPVFEMQYFGYK